MKSISFIICLLCSTSFLLSCNSINKKTAVKNKSADRKIAGLGPSNNMQSSKQNVSQVVFVRDSKPVCVASAFYNPGLLPTGFNPVNANNSSTLPKCNPQDIAKVQSSLQRQQLVVLKDAKSLDRLKSINQTASPVHAAMAGVCLTSGALFGYLTHKSYYEDFIYHGSKPVLQSLVVNFSSLVVMSAGEVIKSPVLQRAGLTGLIAGTCGILGAGFDLLFLTYNKT